MTYTVTNRASGNQFQVENGESLLEAALRQGQLLPYSCRSGSCGSCRGTVVSGNYAGGIGNHGVLSANEHARGERLLCQVHANSDLVIDVAEINAPGAARGLAIRNLPCRVQAIEPLCHDVRQLTLALPKSQSFRYLAGQYIDILLRDGRRRSFSMANPCRDEPLQLHIRRVPGGAFSGRVFESLKERELLRLEGPFGTFFLREERANAILFVAGGTGLAPIKAIIEQALADNDSRAMHLYWGVRSSRDLYAHDWASRLAADHAHLGYTPVLSEPDLDWRGATGWVHEQLLRDQPALSGVDVYAAGPPLMIDAIRQNFFAAGLAEDALFYDSFEHAAS